MAHDVFHHYHSPIHHHAEVQGTQGEQVCGNMAQPQADRGKQQGEGNRERNDDRAADIAQKDEKNDHDQDHAFGKVMHDGVRGVVDQIVPIEIRNDLHSRRQDVLV